MRYLTSLSGVTAGAAAILVGAPSLGGRPRGKARVYGANDPRYGTGLALGH